MFCPCLVRDPVVGGQQTQQGPLGAAACLPSVKRDRLQVMPAQSCSICYPCGVTLSLRPRRSNLLQMPIRQSADRRWATFGLGIEAVTRSFGKRHKKQGKVRAAALPIYLYSYICACALSFCRQPSRFNCFNCAFLQPPLRRLSLHAVTNN